MRVSGMSREDLPSMWASTIQSGREQVRTKTQRKYSFSPPTSWRWDTFLLSLDIITPGFPAFELQDSIPEPPPGPQVFSQGQLHYWHSWFSGLRS